MQATKTDTAIGYVPDFCTAEYEQLYRLVTAGDVEGALRLVCELDIQSRQDQIDIIESQIYRLLQHLAKRYYQAKHEPDSTINHSWIYSINDAVRMINKKNKNWHYVKLEDLRTVIESE